VLQCVVVCCTLLQCVAVCCCALQMLQRALQRVAAVVHCAYGLVRYIYTEREKLKTNRSLQHTAPHCDSVVQCVEGGDTQINGLQPSGRASS